MTKTIKGDLILKKNTTFNEDINVEGSIICKGSIWDINAKNINALDIDAWDITAGDIICISRKKKTKDNKTIAYSIILDRFNREQKELMKDA